MQSTDRPENSASPARERILRTAHDLFYREGVRATGVDRVIAEASVAKVTFYRHFPSKTDLIHAYLERRHQNWMSWFVDALQQRGGSAEAIVPALAEWFDDPDFRGCAFLNSVGELGGAMPEVVAITRRHKQEMVDVIAKLLRPARRRGANAQAIALAIDGAIVRAQFDQTPDAALSALGQIVRSLLRE